MKREDLEKQGLTKEQIDFIMAENGKDVEAQKAKTTAAEAAAKTATDQLTEANKQIDAFKGMDIEGVKKSAEEWKTKAEAAKAEADKQLASLKFDHALDGALTTAKAKNAKAVKALLNPEGLKYNEADGSIIGLKEQLEKIKSESDYLFESETPEPKIVLGGNNKSVLSDPVIMAARKAAGLPEQGK